MTVTQFISGKAYHFGSIGVCIFLGFNGEYVEFKYDCIPSNTRKQDWLKLAQPATEDEIRAWIPWLSQMQIINLMPPQL